MLTEEQLAQIDLGLRRNDMQGDPVDPRVRMLRKHIAALSATIKRLETPVADGEVAAALHKLEKDARWRDRNMNPDADWDRRLADLLRRQAQEIERAAAGNGDPVRFYERDFYVLSNFSAFRVTIPTPFGEADFDTSEHAYHYFKFPGEDVRHVRSMIRRAKSAHEAFKLAEQYRNDRRADWDTVKLDIMRGILRAKADQHEYVRRKLLATGDRQLVEDSWRDDYWGWGPNKDGQNMLGKLWMEVRAALSLNSVETREMKP